MGARVLRIAGVVAAMTLLSGCESVGDFFGSPAEEILEGERISILTSDRGLSADTDLAELPVRLSEPYVNGKWTQYGGSPEHAMYHLALTSTPSRAWTKSLGKGASSDRRILAQPLDRKSRRQPASSSS